VKNSLLCIIALMTLSTNALAQDLTGVWQGTLHVPAGGELRAVLKVSKGDAGALKATFYSIDQEGPGVPVSSISLQGSTVRFTIAAMSATYEGKLSNTDGTSIAGTWTQGPVSVALGLTLADDKTAWTIPDPPPPPKSMPADAKPEFDVATIKPSEPSGISGFMVNPSGTLNTHNTTLKDLIKFGYSLHPSQITGGASWTETDRYDVIGKPNIEGVPSIPQLRAMVQQLVAARFQLTFHREKKELPVYALTIGKAGTAGIKLVEDTNNPNGLPGFGGDGVRSLNVQNATMGEFASFLQRTILDRPVVDQTGLGKTRYDFVLKWTPDAFQLAAHGAGPEAAPTADAPDTPPDIYLAFLQQLGLKIESTKAPVDVVVIDHVEKPSDN
jgi:uncharacterized protein (TIGR03435 family)